MGSLQIVLVFFNVTYQSLFVEQIIDNNHIYIQMISVVEKILRPYLSVRRILTDKDVQCRGRLWWGWAFESLLNQHRQCVRQSVRQSGRSVRNKREKTTIQDVFRPMIIYLFRYPQICIDTIYRHFPLFLVVTPLLTHF